MFMIIYIIIFPAFFAMIKRTALLAISPIFRHPYENYRFLKHYSHAENLKKPCLDRSLLSNTVIVVFILMHNFELPFKKRMFLKRENDELQFYITGE